MIYISFRQLQTGLFLMQEILETREKGKSHIWTFRTREEASVNWKEQFGDLDEVE